jgi:hypothetical protein
MKQHKWHKDEALKMAIKALEHVGFIESDRKEAITACKKALEPQPKEPQYLYVWNVFSKIVFTQDKNGIVIDTWDPSVLPKYIGKIKIEEPNA